jgi:hypothetical protein
VLTGVGAGFAAMLFLCTVAGIAGSGGQKSNSETAKTADSHVVSQASSTSPNAVSDAKRKAAEDKAAADKAAADKAAADKAAADKAAADKAAADKAAADKAAADKAAADKAAADKAAAAAQQPLTSSFANFSCDQLAAEAARMPKNGNVQLLKVRSPGIVQDNRRSYTKPTGTGDALILSCQGTGVWSDGGPDSPVLLKLTIDKDGDTFTGYEPL